MPPKSFHLSPEIHEYLVAHGTPPDLIAQGLIDKTREAVPDWSMMQIAPEQGAFMTILAELVTAREAVEVGTFTGYSALCLARGLTDDGHLVCCDVSEEWTAVGREAWAAAGVEHKIDLRIAPAIETLRSLPEEPRIDLAFIDADKGGYVDYHEELVPRLRPGGVLLVDNVLWGGRVVDPEADDPDTEAIRTYNDHAAADERLEGVMLAVSDGLSLFRRR